MTRLTLPRHRLRYAAAAGLALALSACAQPINFEPASASKSLSEFPVDQAKCDLMSQQVTPGQIAYGPPLFVAIAQQNHDRQVGRNLVNCMVIAGWRVAPPKP